MSNLNEKIEAWAKMSFKENPYGEPIPNKYLYDQRIMRGRKTLADYVQDGNVLDMVYNDSSKTSAAEAEETVQFSEVFHRLDDSHTLCPSNFIVEVIRGLEKWDYENNTKHDDVFCCETIARGMRAFASMIREENLREIVEQYLKSEAARRRKNYKMLPASVKEDVHGKTDITIKYAGAFYRIWSYQATDSGITKTSRRILKGGGRGLNILIPFDMNYSQMVHGWALYRTEDVEKILQKFVTARNTPVEKYAEYRRKVVADKNIIAIPAIFDVA